MKVRMIVEATRKNPEYDPPSPRDPARFTYDVPHTLVVPVDEEIDHPDAYLLCFPDASGLVRAEPIDDEAKAACAWFEKRRQRKAEMIKKMAAEQRRKQKAAASQALRSGPSKKQKSSDA